MDIEDALSLVGSTLRLSTPLLFACLAGLWSERAGVVDVGLEGKMLAGAFAGAAMAHMMFGKPLLFAGVAMTCALPIAYRQAVPTAGLPQMVSESDVRYLKEHFARARLLNHWNFGGLLIFHDRGVVPVFVEGRAATAYPASLLQDWFKLGRPEVNSADWDMVLQKYRIDTVLWVKDHDALRRFLVGARGWKEAYTGRYVSLYVRHPDAKD